jgi:hypothetical protein
MSRPSRDTGGVLFSTSPRPLQMMACFVVSPVSCQMMNRLLPQ